MSSGWTCGCGPIRRRPAGVPGAGGAGLLRDGRPELGAGGLHQGSRLRRRPPGRGGVPGRTEPYIWRKNLDFASIADIHSIKRQIHIYKVDERVTGRAWT
jgi:hypothetical protein